MLRERPFARFGVAALAVIASGIAWLVSIRSGPPAPAPISFPTLCVSLGLPAIIGAGWVSRAAPGNHTSAFLSALFWLAAIAAACGITIAMALAAGPPR